MNTIIRDSGVIVQVCFYHVQAVHLLGPFNRWSTLATPMKQVTKGLWEVCVPPIAAEEACCYFVWEFGRLFGHIVTHDQSVSDAPTPPCQEQLFVNEWQLQP